MTTPNRTFKINEASECNMRVERAVPESTAMRRGSMEAVIRDGTLSVQQLWDHSRERSFNVSDNRANNEANTTVHTVKLRRQMSMTNVMEPKRMSPTTNEANTTVQIVKLGKQMSMTNVMDEAPR